MKRSKNYTITPHIIIDLAVIPSNRGVSIHSKSIEIINTIDLKRNKYKTRILPRIE